MDEKMPETLRGIDARNDSIDSVAKSADPQDVRECCQNSEWLGWSIRCLPAIDPRLAVPVCQRLAERLGPPRTAPARTALVGADRPRAGEALPKRGSLQQTQSDPPHAARTCRAACTRSPGTRSRPSRTISTAPSRTPGTRRNAPSTSGRDTAGVGRDILREFVADSTLAETAAKKLAGGNGA
jgi:hypothetical protein